MASKAKEHTHHSVDIKLASLLGNNRSILLSNIKFWVTENQKNNRNYHEGMYWTFNTTESYHEHFPYIKPNTIGKYLRELEQLGILKVGNFNKRKYDRTKWYTVTEFGNEIIKNPLNFIMKKNTILLVSESNTPLLGLVTKVNMHCYKSNVALLQNETCIVTNEQTIPDTNPNQTHLQTKNTKHLDTLHEQACTVNIQELSIDDFNDQALDTTSQDIQQDIDLDSIVEAEQNTLFETRPAKAKIQDIQQDIDLEGQDPIVIYNNDNQACYKAKAKINDIITNKDIEQELLIPVIAIPYLTKDNLASKLHNYKNDKNRILYQETKQLIKDIAILFSNNVFSKFYA